jgi:hypothetical protein
VLSSLRGRSTKRYSGVLSYRIRWTESPEVCSKVQDFFVRSIVAGKRTWDGRFLITRGSPCLAWFSDDRAIHNPDRAIDNFIEPLGDVFVKQFDTQEQGDI